MLYKPQKLKTDDKYGNFPVSLLIERSSDCKFVRFEKLSGILPFSEFPLKFKETKLVIFPIEAGNGPVSFKYSRLSVLSLPSSPRVPGIDPPRPVKWI